MIKEAIFCDLCGRHVHENTSIALFMVHDIAPIVGMRNTSENDKTEKNDIVLCEFCEKDTYSILNNNQVKRELDHENNSIS